MADRVALSSIRTLTLYKDAYTTGRRSSPVPQLTCEGKACALYTPDVVRCTNAGGYGAEVEWTCNAELPSALRMGRVEVSCEGYSRPGDAYVLKGSCGLKYRLVRVSTEGGSHNLSDPDNQWEPSSIVFAIVFLAVLFFILSGFIKSFFGRDSTSGTPRRPGSDFPRDTGRNMHGWPPQDAPPPYPGHASPKADTQDPNAQWRPGFWTGAALGGIGAYLMNERNRRDTAPNARSSAQYDWEREREARGEYSPPFSRRTGRWRDTDRGEGPSSSASGLGEMRTSSGYGGSNVR